MSEKSVNEETINVIVYGNPHSGKSSLTNSWANYYKGVKVPEVETGRKDSRGTTNYQTISFKNGTCIDDINFDVPVKFFDTAGIEFDPILSDIDKLVVGKLLDGVKSRTNLIEKHKFMENTSNIDLDNKIDVAVIVIPGNQLLQITAEIITKTKDSFLNWIVPSSFRSIEEITKENVSLTLTNCVYLGGLYKHLEEKMGITPIVVVTMLDLIEAKGLTDFIENLMAKFCHKENIFYMTNYLWSNNKEKIRHLSSHDKEQLQHIYKRMQVLKLKKEKDLEY